MFLIYVKLPSFQFIDQKSKTKTEGNFTYEIVILDNQDSYLIHNKVSDIL